MKRITFTSFKGGAGKTTAVMALTSALSKSGCSVSLIDTDENLPLVDWRNQAIKNNTWSETVSVSEADDMRSFESAYAQAEKNEVDYIIIDTRGGGSELNDACVINTDIVVIPSALTTLDMTQALSTFEHVIETHQSIDVDIATGLLMQRVPMGKLTVSQRNDLAELSKLPMFETKLHTRDAFAALGKRGLLHKTHEALLCEPMKKISAGHMVTAIEEAESFANDINDELES